MKSQSYMTRALKARDPRFARILGRLGYEGAPAEEPKPKRKAKPIPKQEDPRVMARAEYERVLGKKPFSGWSAEELNAKIDAFKNPPPADDSGTKGKSGEDETTGNTGGE